MKSKRWMILLIVFIFLQFINVSKVEWVIAEDGGGQDDDAIEIHYYKDES